MKLRLLHLPTLVLGFVAGTAWPIAAAPTVVAPSGITRIVDPGATPTVTATIVTRPASPAEATARISRCSGGRTACSLVDQLVIEVGGRAVEVPPRAVLMLADVDGAQFRRLGPDRYELVLTCGDGAPAYLARLFFNPKRVTRLDLWSDEAGMVEQSTAFSDVSKAFR